MQDEQKPRLVGLNHIALEVGDVEAALAFYGAIFSFELRGRGEGAAFIDMGDQFIALMEGRSQPPDAKRHFGLVVDDRARTLGATASRWWATATCNSPRRRRCCAAWASCAWARARRRAASSRRRAWWLAGRRAEARPPGPGAPVG